MNVTCKRVHHLDREPNNDPDRDLDHVPDNFAVILLQVNGVLGVAR